MAVKTILEEIERDVIDVVNTNFIYNNTGVVPSSNDSALSYESGIEKKGKKIDTCVLYVDIRNSVALTVKHHTQTMGRIYTAFTKAVLKVARYHNGHTRNIIGDRVMIVFPSTNCYTDAVNCAISINHIAVHIINKQFKGVVFKCGIGIDYGELRVIKVGIQRQGNEHAENKGLVWVGYPANIASRLTDNANKTIESTYYEVVRNPINPRAIKPLFPLSSGFFGNTSKYDPNAPLYLPSIETVAISPEEFASSLRQHSNGSVYTTDGKLIRFEKKNKSIVYPSILMTEAVYKGFKSVNPIDSTITNNFWKEQEHQFKNVNSKVFGGSIYWIIK